MESEQADAVEKQEQQKQRRRAAAAEAKAVKVDELASMSAEEEDEYAQPAKVPLLQSYDGLTKSLNTKSDGAANTCTSFLLSVMIVVN